MDVDLCDGDGEISAQVSQSIFASSTRSIVNASRIASLLACPFVITSLRSLISSFVCLTSPVLQKLTRLKILKLNYWMLTMSRFQTALMDLRDVKLNVLKCV